MKQVYLVLIILVVVLTSCQEPQDEPPTVQESLFCDVDSDCEIRDSCSHPCCGTTKSCYVAGSPKEQCPMYLNFNMDECALMDCMYDAAACKCNQNNNQCEAVGDWELE